jgi:hypothetical protein
MTCWGPAGIVVLSGESSDLERKRPGDAEVGGLDGDDGGSRRLLGSALKSADLAAAVI